MSSHTVLDAHLLPQVRRMEAIALRAWPSTTSQYDGTWLVRLTAGHPSKRINSINPLDCADRHDIERRIERARSKFEAFGRPLVFRQTPLCPPELVEYFDKENWPIVAPTLVMMRDIDEEMFENVAEQLPWQDVGTWVDQALTLRGSPSSLKPSLSEVIELIKPEKALFLTKDEDESAIGTALCVRDGKMAGLFEVTISNKYRCKGYGKKIVLSALHWAAKSGAKQAWLHVEDDNHSASSLYSKLGFHTAYKACYRIVPN